MKKAFLILLAATLMFAGCSKKKTDTGNGNPSAPAPSKAILLSPEQNAVCTTGNIQSDSISAITFTWNPSANTSGYVLTFKNLFTGRTLDTNAKATQVVLNLPRNTPYSWYVTSKSDKTSATNTSDTWKFYNAGKATVTYAPFPADLTSPKYGETVAATAGTITLTWQGSSVNPASIASYDIYFGTGAQPPALKSGVSASTLNAVSVSAGETYYWKVVTRDIQGNTSDSDVSYFKVH